MNKKRYNTPQIVLFLVIGIVGMYAWLTIGYSELLYTIQDQSLFLSNDVFWSQCIAKPMGICKWAGAYLTQFFYHPFLGSFILVLFWALIIGVLKLFLKFKGLSSLLLLIPITALLTSITDLGYWVYSLKDYGYAFSHTLAFLITIILVYIGSLANKSKILKWAFALVYPIIGYTLCGSYMFLGALLLIIMTWKKDDELSLAFMLIIAIHTPYFMTNLYVTVPEKNAWWYGFPEFNNNGTNNLRPQIPFYVLYGSTILLATLKRIPNLLVRIGLKSALTILACCFTFAYNFSYRDFNFQREMRMYHAAEENRWEDVLEDAKTTKRPATQQVAMLRNIALLNTGNINKILDYDCWRVDFNLKDDMYHNIIQMGIPYIYYQYGQLHHATRWAIETSVEYGYSVKTLKTLLRCARLSGETELEKKYSDLLNKTLFYKDWHEEPAAHISQLNQDTPEELTNDANQCESFLLTHFMIQQDDCSELSHELAIWSAMLLKNVSYFWHHFGYYHQERKTSELSLPVLQAAAMLGTLSGHDISELMLPEEIIKQYNTFQQKFSDLNARGSRKQQIALALLPEYGHTYWWYYCFGPDEY